MENIHQHKISLKNRPAKHQSFSLFLKCNSTIIYSIGTKQYIQSLFSLLMLVDDNNHKIVAIIFNAYNVSYLTKWYIIKYSTQNHIQKSRFLQ